MLRARSRIDGDAGDQELRIIADEILRDRRDANDHIAGTEDHRTPEETGDKAINHLKPLPDEIRDRGKRAKLEQTEAKFLHHHRKDDRGDAVLKMIEGMTDADQTQSQPPLPKSGLESRCVGRPRCCCSDGSYLVTHDGLIPQSVGVLE